MGKDFRIGLVLGLMLAVVALVWVATRPSLRPQARTAQSPQAGVPKTLSSDGVMPWEQAGSTSEPDGRKPALQESIPAQGGVAGPPPERSAVPKPEAASPHNLQPATPGLPDLTIYERTEKITTTRFHIVRRGDTLSAISRQYYGTPNSWQKILAANQEIIKDPDKIAPGTKLIIPE